MRETAQRLDLAREHDDPYARDLPPLAVDRQRVIHAAAFRRLQHKTQVFVATSAQVLGSAPPTPGATTATDHFRSRLTHTLEVGNLARLIANQLGLCGDLAEVAGLAHDLGHSPFGHAGERALDDCLRDVGGFEHNAHTLRVVETLEHPYPEFRGLNLTRAVRACLAGHTTKYDRPAGAVDDLPTESAVVDLADRLAYALHDLQDGLYAGLIDPAALADVSLWSTCYAGPAAADGGWLGHLRPAIDRIQQTLLAAIAVGPDGMVRLSDAGEAQLAPLERLLLEQLYRHPDMQAADARGRQIVVELFERLVADPAQMPERFARRVETQGAVRVATDYLAGMTDRFCLETHARLCGS